MNLKAKRLTPKTRTMKQPREEPLQKEEKKEEKEEEKMQRTLMRRVFLQECLACHQEWLQCLAELCVRLLRAAFLRERE